jgi:hypothetical protein
MSPRLAAALCLFFYCGHAAWYAAHGQTLENMLWACHLGALLVGAGLLFTAPTLNAVGVLWLLLGVPLWLLDLLDGGELVPTSILTHFGGLALGLWGVRRLGFPPMAALPAAVGLYILNRLSWLLTAPAENVNLAFTVWPGWEHYFPSHRLYLATLLLLSAVVFGLLTPLLRRLGPR